MKILIVDDQEDARIILKKILESVGHTVEEAINGEEALEMANESPPDMIISDILMPVMDGYMFCKEVKGDDKLKNIPFVFHTSSYTNPEDEKFGLGLGAERIIIKPMAPDEFIRIIQDVIKDVKAGRIKLKEPSLKEDKEIYKLYSERLIKKLESTNLDLEKEIIERKLAEEKLGKSEVKYRSVFENTGTSTVIIEDDMTISMANKELEKLTGYSREEVEGKMKWTEFVVKEDLEKMQAYHVKRRENGEKVPTGYEFRLVGKQGNIKDIDVKVALIPGTKRSVVSLLDITERKQAEKEIKEYSENLGHMVEERTRELNRALYDTEEARDRIDGILKSIADGLIVTDIYSRVVLMNRAAEVLMDVRFSEVFDRPIDFAISDKTLLNRLKSTLNAKETGAEFDFQLPGDDPENPRNMRARTSVIYDKQGETTGVVTIIHAVTFGHESTINNQQS